MSRPAERAGRAVGPRVLDAVLDGLGLSDRPAPLHTPFPLPTRLASDWAREAESRLDLQAGDVEALSLARTRARWPGYAACVNAVRDWAGRHGFASAFAQAHDGADIALMACRGADLHDDVERYGDKAFCNLFLSADAGLDVVFPEAGRRVPLVQGTLLLFDTAQPHTVLRRGAARFDAADFGSGSTSAGLQVFLTWELPIDDAGVRRAIGIG